MREREGRALTSRHKKSVLQKTGREKQNKTGGDGAKILNVCLITRTNKKTCEDIAARPEVKQRSAFDLFDP